MSVSVRDLSPEELPAARRLLARACAPLRAGEVAKEKLFGDAAGRPWRRTLAAELEGRIAGVAVVSGDWIRVLAVDPALRGRGAGGALLEAAESELRARGAGSARTADQPGNYLAPGIPADDEETIAWLERRGFSRARENTNLEIALSDNPKVSEARAAELEERARARGYELRRAARADAEPLAEAIARAFSPGWAFEAQNALAHPPGAVHAAFTREGALAAFAAHDGNNRGLGWFGPAGTLPAHRGRGLGAALLLRCLLDVAGAGHSTGTIAWIGPREFYQRVAGVNGAQRFVVLTKELSTR